MVWPALGQSVPPGRLTDGTLTVRGLSLVLPDRTTDDGGRRPGRRPRPVLRTVATADLTVRHPEGVDPRLGLVEVEGEGLTVGAGSPLEAGAWSSAVALAQLALAHELVGAARRCSTWPGCMPSDGSNSAGPSATSKPCAIGWPRPWWPSRRRQAMLEAAWRINRPTRRPWPRHWPGGALIRGSTLPAGAGRHRLHHRARFSSLRRRVFVLDQLFGAARSLTKDLGVHLLESRQLMALPPL